MFKLVYQSFLMLTLVSTYSCIYIISRKAHAIFEKIIKSVFITLSICLFVLVLLYPYFAIPSYYGALNWSDNKNFEEYIKSLPQSYKGLNGITYLKTQRPGDFEAIQFLNASVFNQPVILEAQGDSYTDFARISANTGLPTVLGWTVHEWLWRGSYDIPAPRIEEVKTIYEGSMTDTKSLIQKYNIEYVIIGTLEHEKYPLLNEDKFIKIGKEIFRSSDNSTVIYNITN